MRAYIFHFLCETLELNFLFLINALTAWKAGWALGNFNFEAVPV
jgi:hypothetical protein